MECRVRDILPLLYNGVGMELLLRVHLEVLWQTVLTPQAQPQVVATRTVATQLAYHVVQLCANLPTLTRAKVLDNKALRNCCIAIHTCDFLLNLSRCTHHIRDNGTHRRVHRKLRPLYRYNAIAMYKGLMYADKLRCSHR